MIDFFKEQTTKQKMFTVAFSLFAIYGGIEEGFAMTIWLMVFIYLPILFVMDD